MFQNSELSWQYATQLFLVIAAVTYATVRRPRSATDDDRPKPRFKYCPEQESYWRYLLDKHLECYKRYDTQIWLNLNLHILMVILALVVLLVPIIFPNDNPMQNLKIAGVEVHWTFFHFILPFAFCYAWSQFGYLLFNAQFHREWAWHLIEERDSKGKSQQVVQGKAGKTSATGETEGEHYGSGMDAAFAQGVFVASWMNLNSNAVMSFRKRHFKKFYHTVVTMHGLLYGTAHAVSLALIGNAFVLLELSFGWPSWIARPLGAVAILVAVVYYFHTHWIFRYEAKISNKMQPVCVITTIALSCLFLTVSMLGPKIRWHKAAPSDSEHATSKVSVDMPTYQTLLIVHSGDEKA